MINALKNGYKVSFAEGANNFIHFLRRVPLVGKHISEGLYEETKAKIALGTIKEIFSIFTRIIKKALYLWILLLMPAATIAGDDGTIWPIFIHILFFLNFIAGPFIRDIFMDKTDKKGFLMIVLMKEDPKKYYLSELLYRNIMDFICFLLPMIIIGIFIQLSPLKSLILLVELIAFRFIVEGILLLFWDKTKSHKGNEWIKGIVILMAIVLAYGIPAITGPINFHPVLFNPIFVIGLIILAAVALLYIFKYNQYGRLSKSFITKDNIYKLEANIENMKFADVKINEENIDDKELKTDLFNKKTGYDYLNALFFYRHKNILEKPMKWRLGIIATGFLIAVGVLLFGPITEEEKLKLLEELPNITPALVFWMYIFSTGERICKAMFHNCDVSLLRYAYYREPKVILSNFTARMKKVVTLNVIPAVALCMALTGVVIICDGASKLIIMVPLFLCIISLSAFFAIHHLFMYYVIQPYTKDLTVKSPAFTIVNWIMWIICFLCSEIETSSLYFTLGVFGATMLYMIVALIITYKLAPKTFRLK